MIGRASSQRWQLGCLRSFEVKNREFRVWMARLERGYQGWSKAGLHSEVIVRQ